ncbi:MAG: WecB/TagA/CpsF family glycosyltransferase [Acidimicrobiales bacterium]
MNDRDLAAAVECILGPQPDDGRLPLVVTPNVDDVVKLSDRRHHRIAAAVRRARYALPDGQPIVWASRLLGRPLTARLPGSSLFPPLWQRTISDRRRVLVIAPSDRVATALLDEHPCAEAIVPPLLDVTDVERFEDLLDDYAAAIEAHRPELVFVGICFPKQQLIALGLIERLQRAGAPTPLFLLLGGSFDMHLGLRSRAPGWVQRAGLEWFYRFLQEPRRLFRRYFISDMQFLPLLLRELAAPGPKGKHDHP